MGKVIIFFTSNYPYGTGETFIENEFPFLKESFQKIIIITNSKETKNNRISTEKGIDVIFFPYELSSLEKIISLKGVFSYEFWKELKIIRSNYNLKINWGILKVLLSSLRKKDKVASFTNKIIHNKKLNEQQLWLYSYWLNDMVIGAAEVKKRNNKVKVISRAHGWDLYMERHPNNYLPLRNFTLTFSDACYTISNHGKNYLNQLTRNTFHQKIKLSHLGTFNISGINTTITNNIIHLVSCSSLISLKRVGLIVETLSTLDIPIEWTHLGDGILKTEIQHLATDKLLNKPNITYNFKGQ